MGSNEDWSLESGDLKDPAAAGISKENMNAAARTAQNVSVSLVRKKSDPAIGSKFQRFPVAGKILVNVQEVVLGTKLFVLFPAIPLAIIAQCYDFGRPWIFALSLLGLTPLAERVSFLTEQIAFYTGPTVGGLLNATCGNATELIIAILALQQRKINVVKYSLMGSILSNLLLVLGSSLFCGGLANLKKEQRFDKRQSDVNTLLLLLGVLCILLPLLFKYAAGAGTGLMGVNANAMVATSILQLSRASSIMMLLAYITYLVFQLKTHKQLFDAEAEKGMIDDINDGVSSEEEEEKAAIGFWSAFAWLVGMTLIIALLSEYVVGTIEAASDSWGISVSFISLILLPIVGNAAEHAGSIIFALKNKLDISLGVALGSAAQISMFVVPLCAVVAWVMGVPMNLDFDLLETGVLTFSVILVAFTLQDGTSHYMKGVVLCLSYAAIAACFFVHNNSLPDQKGTIVLGVMVA